MKEQYSYNECQIEYEEMHENLEIIFQRIKEEKEKYYAAEMSYEVKSKIRLNI